MRQRAALPFGPGGPGDKARPGRGNATLFVSMSGSDIATGALDRMYPGSGKFTEDWVQMNLSSSTQWDGFAHVFHNGVGYNGVPAEPSPVTFAFDVRSGKWETLNANTPQPSMDHRGLLVLPEGLVIVGGMEKSQQEDIRQAKANWEDYRNRKTQERTRCH